MEYNETIAQILNHTSIRKWKKKDIEENILNKLYDVAMRTATSNGMQQASIIRVVDKEKRLKIAEICTQKYINEAPEFWIFIADQYRNYQIIEESKTEKNHANDADRFIAAVTDASLMAQNTVNAAESLGLGTVFFGSILNDTKKVIEILELPKYTLPIVGLGIGYPDQKPELKPRMNKKFRIFTDKYENFENYNSALSEHDKEMITYYDLRNPNRPLNKFTEQVVDKFSQQILERKNIINVALEQGFKFDLRNN